MATVRADRLVAPSFHALFADVWRHGHTHYWLHGGRGSGKSSFISVAIVLGMMAEPSRNAVAYRRYGSRLRDSVYAQMCWAIDRLGVSHLWRALKSPLQLVYAPTGQRVLFLGMDDPDKSKSIKAERGYFAYVWYEEAAEFPGLGPIETVNASLLRGGDLFWVFYSFNPPKSRGAWVNAEVAVERPGRLAHRSTYEGLPPEWLGDEFLREAAWTRDHRPDVYRWRYLGEATGTGGEVFRNLTLRPISDVELGGFTNHRRGLDWGYAADPFCYLVMDFDRHRRRLAIFHERYALGVSNRQAAEWVRAENVRDELVYCDSAEPKSIAALRSMGVNALPCRKYAGSVEEGCSFLADDIDEIVIDPARCPNAAREFAAYALPEDAHGNFASRYPDRDNHAIDATRYALDGDLVPPPGLPRATRHRLF